MALHGNFLKIPPAPPCPLPTAQKRQPEGRAIQAGTYSVKGGNFYDKSQNASGSLDASHCGRVTFPKNQISYFEVIAIGFKCYHGDSRLAVDGLYRVIEIGSDDAGDTVIFLRAGDAQLTLRGLEAVQE